MLRKMTAIGMALGLLLPASAIVAQTVQDLSRLPVHVFHFQSPFHLNGASSPWPIVGPATLGVNNRRRGLPG